VSHIGVVAKACADAGADAFTAVNTFVGLSVDVRTRRSHIPGGTGGLSGPAIRPLALAKVRETVRATPLPVVGCGGIAGVEDALQFLVVGASAIQVGTASFRVPDIAARIQDGIREFLEAEGRSRLTELIGSYEDPAV
jgi:dihydroorotate dehydrogenase (NAD+) catalytic subunit